MKIPMSGIMVVHFCRGSFFSSHGFSTSSFLIRLEWKNLFGCASIPVVDPMVDPGMEPYGVEKGFWRCTGSMRSFSGVPALVELAAVVVAVVP